MQRKLDDGWLSLEEQLEPEKKYLVVFRSLMKRELFQGKVTKAGKSKVVEEKAAKNQLKIALFHFNGKKAANTYVAINFHSLEEMNTFKNDYDKACISLNAKE